MSLEELFFLFFSTQFSFNQPLPALPHPGPTQILTVAPPNRVCKIIGTDILLLHEAILHLVLSLEVVFAHPF